jgi:hypothetical protein
MSICTNNLTLDFVNAFLTDFSRQTSGLWHTIYQEPGKRTICVNVVDVFACDTSVTVDSAYGTRDRCGWLEGGHWINPNVSPCRVVTLYFDRKMKGKL